MGRLVSMLLAAVLWSGMPIHAQPVTDDWRPPPPPDLPTKWDWLQTTSGEWLKGELLVMYKDELTFDSDEFDEVTLDWKDVNEVRTAGTMAVGLTERRIAVGRLLVEGDSVRVLGADDQIFSRDEVVSITSGAPREINYWDFDVSLGANYRTGNTDSAETTSSAPRSLATS